MIVCAGGMDEESRLVSIAGYEARVCNEATCAGRCGDKESPLCQCDDICMLLGDCCIDYQTLCTVSNHNNHTADYLERKKVQEATEYTDCIDLGKSKINLRHLTKICVRCPHTYTGSRVVVE